MKNDIFIAVGFLVYIVLSCIDRFIIPIPDMVYIPVMILDFILLVIGIVLRKRENQVR